MAYADTRADIIVYGPDKTLQLAVEVKTKRDASLEWVTQFRRNLLVHNVIPAAPYFLLALPDFFYLWKRHTRTSLEVPPDYKIDAFETLSLYLGPTMDGTSYTSNYAFEFLVTDWLENLVSGELAPDELSVSSHWLVDSGLYEAIKHGSVVTEAQV